MNAGPPLRIGIYVQRFPAPSETFIVTLVLGLLAAGHDVRVFTAAPRRAIGAHWGRFAVLEGREDVRARVIPGLPTKPASALIRQGVPGVARVMLRQPGAFARFVAHHQDKAVRARLPFSAANGLYTRAHFVGFRGKLDILHVAFDVQALGVIDLKDYLGCKVVLSGRGTFQKMSVIDAVPDAPARIFPHVDGYHFISAYLRENAYRLGLSRATPTWLIPPAIDLGLFRPREAEAPEGAVLRAVAVGRLAWEKGYEFAVDAIARARDAGVAVHLTFLGEGPYREAIEFAARQHRLLDDGPEGDGQRPTRAGVRFAGAVARESVIAHLHQADVMFHPALDEGFCNAVIEAQAAGLPVIASDAGGLPENLADGESGFIVPRRDSAAAAAKLMLLAGDPTLRARMGAAGRARAVANFDLNDQIPAFLAMYQAVKQA